MSPEQFAEILTELRAITKALEKLTSEYATKKDIEALTQMHNAHLNSHAFQPPQYVR